MTGPPRPTLRLVYLYPTLMNIYGDLGNVRCLTQRCHWRGITLEVLEVGVGQQCDFAQADLLFMGGAQDRQQKLVATDLVQHKGPALRDAVAGGLVGLIVCGGYQLFGRYYRPSEGSDVPGLDVFPMHTAHPGPHAQRCTGNIVIRWSPQEAPSTDTRPATLVGFENHGGRTYLDPGAQPLGRVLVGGGNNHEDSTEGAVAGNIYGTYLHGSLLPKNPHLADHLITLALRRRFGPVTDALTPLDDALELRAHHTMVRRLHDAPGPANRSPLSRLRDLL